jgi:hypothetical protein
VRSLLGPQPAAADPVQAAGHQGRPAAPGRDPHLQGARRAEPDPAPLHSVNNSQTEPDSIGNPNLKPELALGIDASYEHYWAEGALLSASVSTRASTDYTRNLVCSTARAGCRADQHRPCACYGSNWKPSSR